LITPALADMGYELVQIRLGGGVRRTLQIMVERADRAHMTVEDCADVSRAVSAILDVADPLPGAYTLEVSSPGIDRPLTRPADYTRFAGYEARIETEAAIDGRKRFRGRIAGLEGEEVRLALEDGEARLPLAAIKRAKLILTDELIRAAQAERGA
jgi:ribosome maturation factor RimP